MERQYIGARYVPVFADPIEWSNQRSYEALTIVTYLGSSYTSKKKVPFGVPPTNTEYWAMTGNYNAQIEQYRQTVEGYKDDVIANNLLVNSLLNMTEQLNGKSIVVYGDSISSEQAVPAATYQPSWVGVLRTLLPDSTIVNKAVPGCPITRAGGIASLIASETSFPYDIIIVFGGVNDFRHGRPLGGSNVTNRDINTFNGALNDIGFAFNEKATTKKVIFISPLKERYSGSYPDDYNANMPLCLYRACIKRACNYFGFSYIEGFEAPILNPISVAKRNALQPDGLHPNNLYAPIFANYIAAKIAFESYDDITTIKNRTSCPFFNENVTVTYAYADVGSDGVCELMLSGTVNIDGTTQTIGELPEYLFPSLSFGVPILANNAGTPAAAFANISSTSGNITIRGSVTGTTTVNLFARFNLKNVGEVLTGSI